MDKVDQGVLDGGDGSAVIFTAKRVASAWPGSPGYPYRLREHAVLAFQRRVRPDLDVKSARWELNALCAIAVRTDVRPPWVRISPSIASRISEGSYLMLSDDVAAAVSRAGVVRTVLTEAADPGERERAAF